MPTMLAVNAVQAAENQEPNKRAPATKPRRVGAALTGAFAGAAGFGGMATFGAAAAAGGGGVGGGEAGGGVGSDMSQRSCRFFSRLWLLPQCGEFVKNS